MLLVNICLLIVTFILTRVFCYFFEANPVQLGLYMSSSPSISLANHKFYQDCQIARSQLQLADAKGDERLYDLRRAFVQVSANQMLAIMLNQTYLLDYQAEQVNPNVNCKWTVHSNKRLYEAIFDNPPIPHDETSSLFIRLRRIDKVQTSAIVPLVELSQLKVGEAEHSLNVITTFNITQLFAQHLVKQMFIYAFNDSLYTYIIGSRQYNVQNAVRNYIILLRVRKNGKPDFNTYLELTAEAFNAATDISAAVHPSPALKNNSWGKVIFVAFSNPGQTLIHIYSLSDIDKDFKKARDEYNAGKGMSVQSIIKNYKGPCKSDHMECGTLDSQRPSGILTATPLRIFENIALSSQYFFAWSMEYPPSYLIWTGTEEKDGLTWYTWCGIELLTNQPMPICDALFFQGIKVQTRPSFSWYETDDVLLTYEPTLYKTRFINCIMFKNCVGCKFHEKRRKKCGWSENVCADEKPGASNCVSIKGEPRSESSDVESEKLYTIDLDNFNNPASLLKASVSLHNEKRGWWNVSDYAINLTDSHVRFSLYHETANAEQDDYKVYIKIYYPAHSKFLSSIELSSSQPFKFSVPVKRPATQPTTTTTETTPDPNEDEVIPTLVKDEGASKVINIVLLICLIFTLAIIVKNQKKLKEFQAMTTDFLSRRSSLGSLGVKSALTGKSKTDLTGKSKTDLTGKNKSGVDGKKNKVKEEVAKATSTTSVASLAKPVSAADETDVAVKSRKSAAQINKEIADEDSEPAKNSSSVKKSKKSSKNLSSKSVAKSEPSENEPRETRKTKKSGKHRKKK